MSDALENAKIVRDLADGLFKYLYKIYPSEVGLIEDADALRIRTSTLVRQLTPSAYEEIRADRPMSTYEREMADEEFAKEFEKSYSEFMENENAWKDFLATISLADEWADWEFRQTEDFSMADRKYADQMNLENQESIGDTLDRVIREGRDCCSSEDANVMEALLRDIAMEVEIMRELDDPELRDYIARNILNMIDSNVVGGL